ncbi:MAG: ATP synthase F0 subunit B [Candidatus Binatota bacterium]
MTLFLSELWASSSAGVEEHAASVTEIIFPLINFLIFLYLIKRFLLPVVRSHLRSRREQIVSALGEADESKRRAEEMVLLSKIAAIRANVLALDKPSGDMTTMRCLSFQRHD